MSDENTTRVETPSKMLDKAQRKHFVERPVQAVHTSPS